MSTEAIVTVKMTWGEARALLFASSVGINQTQRWQEPGYREIATVARQKLLEATARTEGSMSVEEQSE